MNINTTPSLKTALRLGLVLNTASLGIELLYAATTGSLALLVDALHDVLDTLTIVSTYVAAHFTSDRRRITLVAAIFNGCMMLGSGAWIGREAVAHFSHPEAQHGGVLMALGLFGMLANGLAAWLVRAHRHNLAVKAMFIDMVIDVFSSLGVFVAGGLSWLTGFTHFDTIFGLVLAILLWSHAWHIIRDASAQL